MSATNKNSVRHAIKHRFIGFLALRVVGSCYSEDTAYNIQHTNVSKGSATPTLCTYTALSIIMRLFVTGH